MMERPDELAINLDGVTTEEQCFTQLIRQFEFPDLYGRSWRGMDEHLFYDPEMRIPKTLIVDGFMSLERRSPDIAVKLRKWLSGFPDNCIKYQDMS